MLYIISDGEYTKIGICGEHRLMERVRTLQTGNARKLKIYCAFPGHGIELESRILGFFQSYSCNGGREWLDVKPTSIIDFVSQTSSIVMNDIIYFKGDRA